VTEIEVDWAEKDFKGKKVAYRMDSGWDIKEHYKGKTASYKGTSQLYFNSFKKNCYAMLRIYEYGATKRWLFVQKKST
jgi:hypothetical protein